LTGALHEDGLADVADGFGGGESREVKLAIMRDSRIGSYGVLALFFALVLKVFAIASVVVGTSIWGGLAAIVASAALSRAASAGLLHVLPPARRDGLSFEAGRPGRSTVLQAAGLAVAVSLVFLWPYSLALGLLLLPLAAAAGLAMTAWLADRQIGGQTGDVAGAAQVVSEVLVLLAAAAVLGR
jgi:adenosylcobinamide-GDP ribazoletransferase